MIPQLPLLRQVPEAQNSDEYMKTLDIEYLRECLSYDAATGILTWKNRPRAHFATGRSFNTFNSRFAGTIARARHSQGYVMLTVDYRVYFAHRIAWMLFHGAWLSGGIDHINGVPDDNKIANLRDVPTRLNARNTKLSRINKSGVPGVRWIERRQRWSVDVRDLSGRRLYLDSFRTFEEAKAMRLKAEKPYGYHENHGRAA